MNVAITWGAVSLAAADEALSNLSLEGERAAQVQGSLRAANIKVIDRRNSGTLLAFTNTRAPLSTAQLAKQFLFSHQLALAAATATADCTVVFSTGPVTYTIKNALLISSRGRLLGVTTIHDYVIKGGLLIVS